MLKYGLVMMWHDNATKQWGNLGAWSLTPSNISYEPKINSRTVQGEGIGGGAQLEGETSKGGTNIFGEAQRVK